MSIVFTNEVAALPANGPAGQMHLIDVDLFLRSYEFDFLPGSINIWDAVATCLFKLSPEALQAFIDPNISSFKAEYTPKDANQSTFLINRRGKEFLTGHYVRVNQFGDWIYQWDNLIRVKQDESNSWHVVEASYGMVSICVLEEVWQGNVAPGLGIVQMPQTAQGRHSLADILGDSMLHQSARQSNPHYGTWEYSYKKDEKWIKGVLSKAQAYTVKAKDKGKDKADTKDGCDGGEEQV